MMAIACGLTLLAACGRGQHERAASGCVHPGVDVLAERARSQLGHQGDWSGLDADSLRLENGSPGTAIMAVRWEGPRGGGVIQPGCSGGVEAVVPTGYPLELRRGPGLRGAGSTVLVTAVSGEGTGSEQRTLWLLGLDQGRLRALWSAPIYDRDQSMPGAGGSLAERQARFSGNGDTIVVSGVVKHLASRDGGTTWVTTDSVPELPKRFCRSGNAPRFSGCD
ncbi:MAG: hypothetical protein JO306_15530 [Gemmatimonadetes bacterium]|nr:hypothetical protein [Gemmatimonadota bacterium]